MSGRRSPRPRGAVSVLVSFLLSASACAAHAPGLKNASASTPRCANNAGLTLPPGFCAEIFADHLGHARDMVVAPNGVVYVNTWSGKFYPNSPPPRAGFLIALQDTTGRGRANVIRRFGPTPATGGHGGTGIALYDGYLYAEANDDIVRYKMTPNSIVPRSAPQVVLTGLPLTGDHPMHPFAIAADGWMYIDSASSSNACQRRNRMLRSPGINPCPELKTRGGIWRYRADRLHQDFSPAGRYATGIRNADGITVDATDQHVYATQMGRDQLAQNWPDRYTPEQGAILPAEELLHVLRGGNYGWPYCYYDGVRHKLMLAPEYGGNGRKVGLCAHRLGPIAAFPAHWAPEDLAFYHRTAFPARYRHGVFIAFHGSWNRAPFPQQGYDVVFQPLAHGRAAGNCQVFANDFAGGGRGPGSARHRPVGLAVGSRGALYVSDDVRGRIYRIVYRGGKGTAAQGAGITACTSMTELSAIARASDSRVVAQTAVLPVPRGATRALLERGDRIFHGATDFGTCAGCHGENAQGTPLGPNLTTGHWIWSNGSYAGIVRTIREGVPHPKHHQNPMPPMGGMQLSSHDVEAVAAYVWALSRRKGR